MAYYCINKSSMFSLCFDHLKSPVVTAKEAILSISLDNTKPAAFVFCFLPSSPQISHSLCLLLFLYNILCIVNVLTVLWPRKHYALKLEKKAWEQGNALQHKQNQKQCSIHSSSKLTSSITELLQENYKTHSNTG